MRIDSHQHFWNYDPAQYGWIQPGSVLQRSYLPSDLQIELTASLIDGCIAVQARQELSENDFLLGLAQEHSFIKGVVGWIDLQSDTAAEQASKFATKDKAIGVRHVVQDESDPDFMKRATFRRGIATLEPLGLAYDILVYWHQLEDAIDLVKNFPNQNFVLDHLAKPAIATGQMQPWANHIHTLAGFSNVSCKVSGMVTEADHQKWNSAQLKPYFDTVLEAFGPSRLLFGSDWPVIRLAAEYRAFLEVIHDFIAPLSQSEKTDFMGLNAARIYRLDR
jgi:L-fuconolactonase